MATSKRYVRGPAVLALSALAGIMLADTPSAQVQGAQSGKPWIMPFDIGRPTPNDPVVPVRRQRQVYDFIWKTFVAINWPQRKGGARGEPDTRKGLTPWGNALQSEGPVVWQSYRRPGEVFVKPKEWPVRWNAPMRGPLLVCPATPSSGVGTPTDGTGPGTISAFTTNYSDYADGLNQPYIQANYPTGPVTDQNGSYLRYEVGLNRSYFTYIGHYRYYNPAIQKKAVREFIAFADAKGRAPKPSNRRGARFFQPLPNGTEVYLRRLPGYARQGIVEWKAAWKVLGGDDVAERFYRRWAYFLNPDGSCTGPFKVGLVALHIHRVTPFGHIGATFEQVDNTNLQPAYSRRQVPGAARLPAHASLNPGRVNSPDYPNGYEICDPDGTDCKGGIGGNLLPALKDGDVLPLDPKISNIVRQVPIPADVQERNIVWRDRLKGTVWFYYQLIGTQNPNIEEPNPDLGPGVRGAQVSNTTNLINTALESYTQKGWSCALCHQNAFPQGVTLPLPSFGPAYDPLHTISFLLQNARSNREK